MTVIEHEVELLAVLERVLHFDDEGVVNVLQDAPLRFCVFNLVEFTNDLLFQDFHSVVLLRLFVQHEQDFAIRAYAEHFQRGEVFD